MILKICLVNLEYYSKCGGAGTVARNLGMALSKNGAEVYLVSLSNQTSREYSPEKNFHICEVYRPEKPTPFEYVKYCFSVYKAISVCNSNIVLTQYSLNAVLAYINYVFHKIPYCIWVHNDPYIYRKDPFSKFDLKIGRYLPINKKASRFIAVSSSIVKPLYDVYGQHSVVIENGADLKSFYPKPVITPPTSTNFKIISVTRFVSGKGLEDEITAMAEVVKSCPSAELILVGDGPLRSTLEKQVQDLHLEDNVTFTGFIPNNEVVKYYHQAHVYLLSSENEGFPIVLFEAMGCGLPIVSTRVGAIPAVISEENGVLIPIQSPHKMAGAVCYILSLPEAEYVGMAKRNIATAQEHGWEKVAEQYMGVIKDVLL